MNFLSKSALFTAFFLDFFSFSLMIPLLPLLVFAYCPETKYMTLGFLLATYPLAQMIGSRPLGLLSDKTNKKWVLLLAYLGNLIGYLLSAFAITTHEVIYLFLGHFIAGCLGANMSMTYALIADEPCEKNKFKGFSLTSLLISITFIFSPLISRKLYISTDIIGLVTLMIASGATLCNFVLIWLCFTPLPKTKVPKELPLPLADRPLMAGAFVFFFAWYGFIKFFQAYVIDDLSFSYDRFCILLSLMGIVSALTQFLNYFYFSNFTPTPQTLKGAIYLLGGSIGMLLFIENYAATITVTLLIAVSHAIISPHLLYAFSNVDPSSRGKTMGGYQAVQALAKTLAPPILGILMTGSLKLPIIFCSFCLFICPEIQKALDHRKHSAYAAGSSPK